MQTSPASYQDQQAAPWEQTARAMLAAAEQNRSPAAVLRKSLPGLHRQLAALRTSPELLRMWGDCLNFDEHAQDTIVHAEILKTLGELAGVEMSGEIVHAGIQHTYGYLLSWLETPYGYKRQRWTDPDLEAGLGLQTPTLRPFPQAGSLLANLTYFLGRIAFGGQPREMRLLRKLKPHCGETVLLYPYRRLKTLRIAERTTAVSSLEGTREVILQFDLTTLPYAADDDQGAAYLMTHSVWDPRKAHRQLITAFPMNRAGAAETRRWEPGKTTVQTRYNAYVDGVTGKECEGRREIWTR